MITKKFVYWEDEGMILGYMEEFPDYMSQGESLDELRDNLKDIHKELISGNIPNVRHVAELDVA